MMNTERDPAVEGINFVHCGWSQIALLSNSVQQTSQISSLSLLAALETLLWEIQVIPV